MGESDQLLILVLFMADSPSIPPHMETNNESHRRYCRGCLVFGRPNPIG
jgi:hypothetical protein